MPVSCEQLAALLDLVLVLLFLGPGGFHGLALLLERGLGCLGPVFGFSDQAPDLFEVRDATVKRVERLQKGDRP